MEQSDDIVGFAALDSAVGEVRALYVAPKVVRCGIGTRLLEAVEPERRVWPSPGWVSARH